MTHINFAILINHVTVAHLRIYQKRFFNEVKQKLDIAVFPIAIFIIIYICW